MSVTALQGIVENGQIRLDPNVQLPEKAVVYVIIPELNIPQSNRIRSPRLANRAQADDFRKEVIKEVPNAGV